MFLILLLAGVHYLLATVVGDVCYYVFDQKMSQLAPIIDAVMPGSNISSYATIGFNVIDSCVAGGKTLDIVLNLTSVLGLGANFSTYLDLKTTINSTLSSMNLGQALGGAFNFNQMVNIGLDVPTLVQPWITINPPQAGLGALTLPTLPTTDLDNLKTSLQTISGGLTTAAFTWTPSTPSSADQSANVVAFQTALAGVVSSVDTLKTGKLAALNTLLSVTITGDKNNMANMVTALDVIAQLFCFYPLSFVANNIGYIISGALDAAWFSFLIEGLVLVFGIPIYVVVANRLAYNGPVVNPGAVAPMIMVGGKGYTDVRPKILKSQVENTGVRRANSTREQNDDDPLLTEDSASPRAGASLSGGGKKVYPAEQHFQPQYTRKSSFPLVEEKGLARCGLGALNPDMLRVSATNSGLQGGIKAAVGASASELTHGTPRIQEEGGPPPLEEVSIIDNFQTENRDGNGSAMRPLPTQELKDSTTAVPGARIPGILAARSARKFKSDIEEVEERRRAGKAEGASTTNKVGKAVDPGSQRMNESTVNASNRSSKSTSASSTIENEKSSFSGLKRGFFCSTPKSKTLAPSLKPKSSTRSAGASATTSSVSDIPFIKPSTSGNSPFAFPNVANPVPGFLSQPDPEILSAVQSDPELLRALDNPRFARAIEEFSKDPKAAARKYSGDKLIEDAMMKFTKLIGVRVMDEAKKNGVEMVGSEERAADAAGSRRAMVEEMNPTQSSFQKNYKSLDDREKALVDRVAGDRELQVSPHEAFNWGMTTKLKSKGRKAL
ncbi:hypothetical protein HDU93_000163 [Gonapodya sp. JEL0774]|nr:hypothetical protein HDU93_000163 [Gonapodya sp. JEL0774]